MTLITIAILVGCGMVVNLVSALFGIGGGVLLVPILRTLFPELSMQMVAATSLTIVMGTSLLNLLIFRQQRIAIELKSLMLWSLGMIAGVQLGFELSFNLSDQAITAIFALTLSLLAMKTLFIRKKSPDFHRLNPNQTARDRYVGTISCGFGGLIAGITGIGGGSIMSPLINQLRSVRAEQLAVYTNAMMTIGGVGNLYGYLSRTPASQPDLFPSWQFGYVNFALVGIILASSFAMSFFSFRLRGKLTELTATYCLGGTLLAIVVYTVWMAWG